MSELKRIENFQEQKYERGESFGWVNYINQYFFNFFNPLGEINISK